MSLEDGVVKGRPGSPVTTTSQWITCVIYAFWQGDPTRGTWCSVTDVAHIIPKVCILRWRDNQYVIKNSHVWGFIDDLIALCPGIRHRCVGIGCITSKIGCLADKSDNFLSSQTVVKLQGIWNVRTVMIKDLWWEPGREG